MGKYMEKRKGFTLVELLIVIIIIGVLASSMLLVVGNAEDKAEATVIVSDMRSMKSAVTLFKLKEGRWPVLASVTNSETGFGGIHLAGDIEIPSLRHLLILSAAPAFAKRPESPGKSNDAPGRNKDAPASGTEGGADRSALQKMFGGASLEGFSIVEENGHAYLIYNIENRSRGVKGKLALMAASAGLLNKDGEQYNNENEVLMKLD